MKVSYNKKHDIAYIRVSSKKPDGAIETDEGVALDTTERDEIVGIEIFESSKRFPLRNLFTLEPVRFQFPAMHRHHLASSSPAWTASLFN